MRGPRASHVHKQPAIAHAIAHALVHAIVRRFWQPRGPPSLLWQARRNLPGLHHLDECDIGSPAATAAVATPTAVRRLGRPELLPRVGGDSRAQDPELQDSAVREPLPVELREVLLVAAECAVGSPAATAAVATPAAVRRLGPPELLRRTRGDSRTQDHELQARAVREQLSVELREVLLVIAGHVALAAASLAAATSLAAASLAAASSLAAATALAAAVRRLG